MQNKTKLFKTAICIITTLILIFGTIPCGAVLSNESNAPNFTNLVVFMKFSDEDEFINNTYADTTVRNILDNTYNKSVYNVADYFKTVSGGKMNMQTLYLFDNNNSLTLSKPRGYYAEKDDQTLTVTRVEKKIPECMNYRLIGRIQFQTQSQTETNQKI